MKKNILMIGILAAALTACGPASSLGNAVKDIAEEITEDTQEQNDQIGDIQTGGAQTNGVKNPGDQTGGVQPDVSQDPGDQPGDTAAGSGSSGDRSGDISTGFTVRYLDVGQADAALITCDGETMLIDGGNRDDSDLIYTYLQENNITALDYVVCTHAHEDHVGGLPGALNAAKAGTAFAPVTEYDSRVFQSFKKYLDEQGTAITVPKASDTFTLGSAQAEVLGPIRTEDVAETNNTSIVIKITYGETSFLFTGDAEREEEQDILDAGYDLKCTVLKVGHHGGDTSTTYPFLREIAPEYAVISVGTGNSYGHPTEAVLSRLRDAGVQVFRTDEMGDIVCTSDGKQVTFETERGGEAPSDGGAFSDGGVSSDGKAPEGETAGQTYILNTKSKKFHLPTCSGVKGMSEENRETFEGDREALLKEGYEPCGICKP